MHTHNINSFLGNSIVILQVTCIFFIAYGHLQTDSAHIKILPQKQSPAFTARIKNFVLVDALNEGDIRQIQDGDTINVHKTGHYINFRANCDPLTVGSVVFGYDADTAFQIENFYPYALAGDNEGDYFYLNSRLGLHTITATPYSKTNGKGNQGISTTIRIFFVDIP